VTIRGAEAIALASYGSSSFFAVADAEAAEADADATPAADVVIAAVYCLLYSCFVAAAAVADCTYKKRAVLKQGGFFFTAIIITLKYDLKLYPPFIVYHSFSVHFKGSISLICLPCQIDRSMLFLLKQK